ncbi:hypothetical protein [Mesorhizobium sp. M7A.F.Ca.US.001.04.1.1]|uniref:hypothetical protein n=1 Tax=Mesorhizobium sp. M7A.F.Ca.US.001.04.1.1 TaxID=2496726 RepID=UPI001FE0B22D|nr:hypothetical protein [Mesorhizobium sp. M7A.F.Ca.US.001.04.1.1]
MNAVHPLPDPWARAPVLRAHLEPIWSYLNEDAVSEIAINRPGELFIERLGEKEMEHVVKREVTPGWIRHISTGVASATNQVINEENRSCRQHYPRVSASNASCRRRLPKAGRSQSANRSSWI